MIDLSTFRKVVEIFLYTWIITHAFSNSDCVLEEDTRIIQKELIEEALILKNLKSSQIPSCMFRFQHAHKWLGGEDKENRGHKVSLPNIPLKRKRPSVKSINMEFSFNSHQHPLEQRKDKVVQIHGT